MCDILTDFLTASNGWTNIDIHKSLTIILDKGWVWLVCHFFLKDLAIIFISCMTNELLAMGFSWLEIALKV